MRTRTTLTAAGVVGLALGAAGLAAGATASATAPPASDGDIDCAAIAADIEAAEISTFVEAVEASNGAIADAEPPFTIFIPVNAAFDVLPDGVLDAILGDADLLGSLLDYHVIPGQVLGVSDLAEAGSAESLSGEPLEFALDGDTLTINAGAATVVCPDLTVDDAMVHIIDGLLQPPSLAAGGSAGSTSVPGSSTPASSVPAFDADQQAVATAWETATDSSLTFDDQAPFIENAEELRATIEAYPAAADVVGGISTNVKSVEIDGDTATVSYTVSFNGVEQPYGELQAALIRVDGSWIVPQAEICAVYAYARNACPA